MSGAGCWARPGLLHPMAMPIRGLLQLILFVALVLAPICGMGGPAMAMPMPEGAQASKGHDMSQGAGHCAEMDEQQDEDSSNPGSNAECRMIGCAGLLVHTPRVGEGLFLATAPMDMPAIVAAPGLNPAAEPRPPRLS